MIPRAARASVFGRPAFETIRRVTFVVIGLAPVAFLFGLLARPPRALGRRRPAGRAARRSGAGRSPRRARARASRPVAELAYWLPRVRELGRPRRPAGRAAGSRRGTGDDADRPRRRTRRGAAPRPRARRRARAARRGHRGRRHRARERAPAGRARARLEELQGSRARVLEAGQKERQRLERNLHDGAQQRLGRAVARARPARGASSASDPERDGRLEQARREIADLARRAARRRARPPPRGRQRARARGRARGARGAARRCPSG